MRPDYDNYSLVVGRFQPLHKGHMDVIRKCAEESEHLTIGIGSAQYSHTPENPFTAGERYMMINKSLRDEGISNYSIVPIEDLNRYPVWVAHVVSLVPPFRRVYSNNPLTRRLFEEAGFDVRESPLYNRSIFSGTEIRRRIVNDEEWRPLVPEAVAEVLDDIDGVNRLKQISRGSIDAPL
jgi:nicotinamide-nucleotide adenylyltransferase